MDKFEKNIDKKLGAFDTEKADKAKMWKHISAGLEHPKPTPSPTTKKKAWWKLLLAIGIPLCIATAYLAIQSNKKASSEQMQQMALQEVNTHYGQLVSLQIKKLEASDALTAQEKTDFLESINELANDQTELRRILTKNIDNQQVLEAIVDNFHQQIKLITQLLDRLNDTKEKEYETGISI